MNRKRKRAMFHGFPSNVQGTILAHMGGGMGLKLTSYVGRQPFRPFRFLLVPVLTGWHMGT